MAKLVTFIEKEFILKQVEKNNNPVLVFGMGKCINTKLKSFDKDQMTVTANVADIEIFNPWDHVSVFLAYENQRVTFPGKVKKSVNDTLIIALPEKMFKSPQRKSVRISPPKNVKLDFYLQNEIFQMDCPESSEYSPIEMPALSVGFNTDSISSLLNSFKAKSDALFSKNGITMFIKGRKPESLEEKIVASFGRTLLIPSMYSGLPPNDPYHNGRIVTQSMLDKYEGPSIFIEGSSLDKIKATKAEKGIVSELYCPIQFYQYVVGYIYLMTDKSKTSSLDFRAVDYAWEFSRILAYNLKANNYFKIDLNTKPDSYKPRIIDFSAGGCLLCMPKTKIRRKIEEGALINTTLRYNNEEIEIKARIARNFDDNESEYFGVSFIDITPEVQNKLKTIIYARDDEQFVYDESGLKL